MDTSSKPEAIKRYDNPEPLFPGEHWVALPGQFPRISSLRTWVEG